MSYVEISIFYFVLNNMKFNGGRKATCAVHAAHWVLLQNIVEQQFLVATMWLVYNLGNLVGKREDNIKTNCGRINSEYIRVA